MPRWNALEKLTKLCGAGFAVLTGCSFTYQSVYEGDVRFEHCYRLDEERRVSLPEKRVCWHDWSTRYTYGQTRDRIEYAFARERALGQAEATGELTAPRGLVFPNGAIWAPQPLNAFASPPQTLSRDAGAPDVEGVRAVSSFAAAATSGVPSGAASATSGGPPPGATCGGNCNKAWIECGESCKGSPCQSGCDERYRGCMRTCF